MSQTLTNPSPATTPQQTIQTLHVQKEISIDAPPDVVFESILEEIGPASVGGDGSPMAMKIEAWPGGRWYRDLGNNAGHLWGHVQVIKPPTLLEICGPMMMSYPVASHIQYRLTPQNGATILKLTHRAIGLIDPAHSKGVQEGWNKIMEKIRTAAQRRASGK